MSKDRVKEIKYKNNVLTVAYNFESAEIGTNIYKLFLQKKKRMSSILNQWLSKIIIKVHFSKVWISRIIG